MIVRLSDMKTSFDFIDLFLLETIVYQLITNFIFRLLLLSLNTDTWLVLHKTYKTEQLKCSLLTAYKKQIQHELFIRLLTRRTYTTLLLSIHRHIDLTH